MDIFDRFKMLLKQHAPWGKPSPRATAQELFLLTEINELQNKLDAMLAAHTALNNRVFTLEHKGRDE